MNPYESGGSVSTVTASVRGGASFSGSDPYSPNQPSQMRARALLGRLTRFVRPHGVLLVLTLVASACTVILQLYIPILIGQGIDLIVGEGRVEFVALAPLLTRLALIVLFAALSQWVQGISVNALCYKTVRDMRVVAGEKLTRMPLSYIDSHPHGDLLSRVVNDVDQIGDGLLQGFTQLFTGVFTIAGTLVFMLTLSVSMAVVVVLVTPLSVVAASLLARVSSGSFAAQQRVQGELGAHIEEMVGNQRLVEAFAFGDRAQQAFDATNARLYDAGERAQFLSSLSNPATRFINNLIYAVVAVLGCLCVITSIPAPLTVGGVQTFLSYANQYTKPFNEVTGVITQIQTAFAAAGRLFELLDAPEQACEPSNLRVLTNPSGDVAFDHVDFSYVPNRPLLQNVCVHARAGQRIALVGPTGCGKTTLINLLLRFYDPQAGRITFDGIESSGYTRSSLRRGFGMVLQDSWLFEGTVLENIAYGCPDATREKVVQAAQRAHAHTFIEALSHGYDTVLGEEGATLSQGQRQLLCIARVMLTDPAVLLLDEATSSIDTRTELQVQAAFDELMRGRTSFVVAHRLSTIVHADCILVMRDGRIVEQGTHEELLAAQGFYYQLYCAS